MWPLSKAINILISENPFRIIVFFFWWTILTYALTTYIHRHTILHNGTHRHVPILNAGINTYTLTSWDTYISRLIQTFIHTHVHSWHNRTLTTYMVKMWYSLYTGTHICICKLTYRRTHKHTHFPHTDMYTLHIYAHSQYRHTHACSMYVYIQTLTFAQTYSMYYH